MIWSSNVVVLSLWTQEGATRKILVTNTKEISNVREVGKVLKIILK